MLERNDPQATALGAAELDQASGTVPDYWEYSDEADRRWRTSAAYAAETWTPQSLDPRVQIASGMAINHA